MNEECMNTNVTFCSQRINHMSVSARSAALVPYNALNPLVSSRNLEIAMLSVRTEPSSKIRAGTSPSGLMARNSGVRFSPCHSNICISSRIISSV